MLIMLVVVGSDSILYILWNENKEQLYKFMLIAISFPQSQQNDLVILP